MGGAQEKSEQGGMRQAPTSTHQPRSSSQARQLATLMLRPRPRVEPAHLGSLAHHLPGPCRLASSLQKPRHVCRRVPYLICRTAQSRERAEGAGKGRMRERGSDGDNETKKHAGVQDRQSNPANTSLHRDPGAIPILLTDNVDFKGRDGAGILRLARLGRLVLQAQMRILEKLDVITLIPIQGSKRPDQTPSRAPARVSLPCWQLAACLAPRMASKHSPKAANYEQEVGMLRARPEGFFVRFLALDGGGNTLEKHALGFAVLLLLLVHIRHCQRKQATEASSLSHWRGHGQGQRAPSQEQVRSCASSHVTAVM
jgi:hypothetical protein